MANDLFYEGLRFFQDSNLEFKRIVSRGNHIYIIPWVGDKIVNTLTVIFVRYGYKVDSFGGIIEIENAKMAEKIKILENSINEKELTNAELAKVIENRDFKQTEKYDYLLPIDLLNKGYGAKTFDINATLQWLSEARANNYF